MNTEDENTTMESIRTILSNLDSSDHILPEDLARLKGLNEREFANTLNKSMKLLEDINALKVIMANVYKKSNTEGFDVLKEMQSRFRQIGIIFNTKASETKINTVKDTNGKPEIIIDLTSNSSEIEAINLLIRAIVLYYAAKDSAPDVSLENENLVDRIKYKSFAVAMLLVVPMLELLMFEKDSAVLLEPVKSLAEAQNKGGKLYEINSMDITLPQTFSF